MTNRERAERIEAECTDADNFHDNITRIESELDAAERRGWIEALEWVKSTGMLPIDTCGFIRKKLAEFKAEENKR